MVAVLLIGGLLGLVIRRATGQSEAVAAINRAGGWVRYQPFWEDDSTLQTRELWEPTGLYPQSALITSRMPAQ